jgi:hypothetical protein
MDEVSRKFRILQEEICDVYRSLYVVVAVVKIVKTKRLQYASRSDAAFNKHLPTE